MKARVPQIVAFGGGGFSTEWGNALLDDYVLELARAAARPRPTRARGRPRAAAAVRPRVCFLPTASGDADHYVVRFYRAFPANRCEPSHISLFRRETGVGDPRAHLLAQDLIYVGGGSLVSLLGTWRAHQIDEHLRAAWEAGVVLCGGSAGALCWFSQALSGFHEGPPRRIEALGLLPWSCAVHYHEEQDRRASYLDAIGQGMPAGYGVGDSAALHFVGTELAEVISSRPMARAAFVARGDAGVAAERELPVRYLGGPALDGLPTAVAVATSTTTAAAVAA